MITKQQQHDIRAKLAASTTGNGGIAHGLSMLAWIQDPNDARPHIYDQEGLWLREVQIRKKLKADAARLHLVPA